MKQAITKHLTLLPSEIIQSRVQSTFHRGRGITVLGEFHVTFKNQL